VLAQADLGTDDIDGIIYVNTTGLATPSIDARLINVLGLRHDVRRTPLWGPGCAGAGPGVLCRVDAGALLNADGL
jgi:alkylresorcinol/alkylpyrone synthase